MSLLLTLGLGGSATPPTPPTGGDTPYMNLLLPTVSVTLGPLYATEVNNAFLRVDAHDHSDGFGHRVGTNGLNINADLTFHGFNANNLLSAGFNIQSPTAGLLGSIYFQGQDLWVADGAGNNFAITAAGAVNITGIGGWSGLSAPAAAEYDSVTKKFSLKTNTVGPVYGLLAVGDILLYPGDPNLGTLPFIRLATPNTGVSTYTLQLPPAVPPGVGKQQMLSLKHDGTMVIGPTPPSVTSFMRMDSNGVPAADVTPDNSTIGLVGAGPYNLQVKAQGITTVQIAPGAVTQAQQGSVAMTTSTPTTGSALGAGPTTINDCTFTALGTGSGRPVVLSVNAYTGTTSGTVEISTSGAGGPTDSCTFEIVNQGNSAVVFTWDVGFDGTVTANTFVVIPAHFIPVVAGLFIGSNTFRLRVKNISAGAGVSWSHVAMTAVQL